ncbi:MAG: SDR family NAD(P)-dependent oxidoreductase [Bacilli bacterium]|nr:SDR family NAD(P)-dependent oxidoreductase [Bacilli bacterium]
MICLVTGSSRGLGKEIIKKFASEGFEVIINYNKSEKDAYKLADEIGSKARVIKCDISNEEEVRDMFDQIDHLDVLINNAAIADDKDPLEKRALEFNRVLHTNLTGTFLVTKYAIEKMGNGSIVNISSTNGIDTYYPESIDYDASKAGIISLTHNFAKYLSDIRVNCICPDWIDTEMNKDMDEIYKAKINFIKPDVLASLVYKVAMDKGINDQIIKVGDNSVR